MLVAESKLSKTCIPQTLSDEKERFLIFLNFLQALVPLAKPTEITPVEAPMTKEGIRRHSADEEEDEESDHR